MRDKSGFVILFLGIGIICGLVGFIVFTETLIPRMGFNDKAKLYECPKELVMTEFWCSKDDIVHYCYRPTVRLLVPCKNMTQEVTLKTDFPTFYDLGLAQQWSKRIDLTPVPCYVVEPCQTWSFALEDVQTPFVMTIGIFAIAAIALIVCVIVACFGK